MKNKHFSSFRRFLGAAVIGLMAFASAGCSQIDTGNVGVVTSVGKTDMQELAPGFHVTWFAGVDEVTTKEVMLPLADLKPKAKDNLTISDLDVDVYFKIDPTKVAETKVKYQGDATKDSNRDTILGVNRVSREARSSIVKAVAQINATEMHTKRAELEGLVAKTLQEDLNATDPGVWTITVVNVKSLVTDQAIEKSIRAAAETDQAIARAKKEQELAKIEADKLLVIAQGQADANEVIARSLTPQLIRLKEIEAQKAFATNGTHTVLLPQGQGALVSVGK